MKVDLEQLKAIKELLGQQSTQNAVPVVSVPQDKDSFASFTGGLRQNWVFVMAIVATGLWFVNSIADGRSTDMAQQNDIDAATAAIVEIKATLDSFESGNTEILRRLDAVQKDIEFIKNN